MCHPHPCAVYLQVHDEDFAKAAQQPSATPEMPPSRRNVSLATNETTPGFPGVAAHRKSFLQKTLPPLGGEPSRDAMAETVISVGSGTDSGTVGARDDGLDRLAELWPMLSADDRAALLTHAEHLAALRWE